MGISNCRFPLPIGVFDLVYPFSHETSKKKILQAHKVGEDVANVLKSAPVDENAIAEIRKKDFENYYAIIQTEDNFLIQTFSYKYKGKTYFIPEPNPIVIYFELARFNAKHVKSQREKVFNEITANKPNPGQILQSYDETIDHARDFINFYEPSLIEECDCGKKDDD